MTTTDDARTEVLGAAGPQALFGPRSQDPVAGRAARRTYRHNARLRPAADALLDEYDELIGRLYGPRQFRPFTLPAA